MTKYLIALPNLRGQKGFNCPTILVSAKGTSDAIAQVGHLRPHAHIGDVKQVNY